MGFTNLLRNTPADDEDDTYDAEPWPWTAMDTYMVEGVHGRQYRTVVTGAVVCGVLFVLFFAGWAFTASWHNFQLSTLWFITTILALLGAISFAIIAAVFSGRRVEHLHTNIATWVGETYGFTIDSAQARALYTSRRTYKVQRQLYVYGVTRLGEGATVPRIRLVRQHGRYFLQGWQVPVEAGEGTWVDLTTK